MTDDDDPSTLDGDRDAEQAISDQREVRAAIDRASRRNSSANGEPQTIGQALAGVAEAFAESPIAKWTDAQWEAHEKRVAVWKDQEERAEREKIATDRLEILLGWGVPQKDLSRAALLEHERSEAVQALATFDRDPRATFLVLAGLPWAGKTTAAAVWLVNSRRPKRHPRAGDPMFVSAAKLTRASSYDDASGELARAEWARLLVLDDLGAEFADAKGHWQARLDALIDARYENELPTIITTNLTADDFKARYQERITRRISESGRFVIVRGDFKDRRAR